ncbi:MAG: ferrous iron transport protein A [Piscirickettsiaceae bacterium]|nr:ferrous iron transport protein A [Piscirickettsiaceae bacterium]
MYLQSLSSLHPGQIATVQAIRVYSTGFHFRLSALGFKLGKKLLVIRIAPLNGPIHLRIGNTEIMLRRNDANMIEVSS